MTSCNQATASLTSQDLGLSFPPGGDHYRAFVGPPSDYDLVAAMSFNLLTCVGLRQAHSVLDIGCGSLRVGRLLIPYLNVGNYTGVEPNEWLIEDGIRREIGADLITIKQPHFEIADSLTGLSKDTEFDFALAQSIFSHCGPDLLAKWLRDISMHLKVTGAMVGTFLTDQVDCAVAGWTYPACVSYRRETIAKLAEGVGMRFILLDWRHPRQTWALFHKPDFDATWVNDGQVSWNRMLEHVSG